MADFLLTDVDVIAVSLCKKGANRKRIFLKKSDEELTNLRTSPIYKSADWGVMYTVVAEPGNEELPGIGAGAQSGTTDAWASEEEIRKASHGFMRKGGLINFQHKDLEPVGRVVENFIAPSDFEVVDPTGTAQVIRKGAWVIGIEPNEDMKALVDAGEIDGVSYEGIGTRNAVAKADPAKGAAYRKCKKCGAKMGYDAAKCPSCGAAYVKKTIWERIGLASEDATVQPEDALERDDRSLLEKIAEKLGISSDESHEDTHEEDEVPLTDQEKAALAKVEGIESQVGEHATKLGSLESKLDTLLSRIPEPEKPVEEQREELAKSIGEMAETLESMQEKLAKLETGSSTQDNEPDTLKKTNDPDAALAAALFG